MNDSTSNASVTIKKYANRRLYNTATSSYVTLENLSTMIKEGTQFNVYDAKTGEDLTRSVLTQIIVEEESKSGQNLLPISFLRQLIGFYGDNMQWMVPKYLEQSMQWLTKNQGQMRDYFQNTIGTVGLPAVNNIFPFGTTLEEMSKQNMAMFEKAMTLFSPFAATQMQDFLKTAHAANTCTPTSTKTSATTSSCPSATTTSSKTTATPTTSSTCGNTASTAPTNTCCSTTSKTSTPSSTCCQSTNKTTATTTPTNTSTAKITIPSTSIPSTTTSSTTTPSATTTSTTASTKASTTPTAPSPTDLSSYRATASAPTATKIPNSDSAEEMQQKISSLQKQLAELAKRRG